MHSFRDIPCFPHLHCYPHWFISPFSNSEEESLIGFSFQMLPDALSFFIIFLCYTCKCSMLGKSHYLSINSSQWPASFMCHFNLSFVLHIPIWPSHLLKINMQLFQFWQWVTNLKHCFSFHGYCLDSVKVSTLNSENANFIDKLYITPIFISHQYFKTKPLV